MIIAVDPGVTTGWAKFKDGAPKPIEFGELKWKEEFSSWLKEQTDSDTIWVVEDYKVRPESMSKQKFSHTWSAVIPARVIGAIEYHAEVHGQIYHPQQPSLKPAGYGLAGMKYVKGSRTKLIHVQDAIAHGVYFIHRNGPRIVDVKS